MIYKHISVSVTGKSHLDRDEPGQDSCRSGAFRYVDKDFFVGIVSDGAGSTSHGGIGAEMICEKMYMQIIYAIRGGKELSTVTDEDLKEWISNARQAIITESEKNNLRINDYACTLIGVVTTDNYALYFQIGDGCIVIGNNEEYSTVFWPEQGEYANSTYFISDEMYVDHLKIEHQEKVPKKIAIFTDGIQGLVLSFTTKTVHAGFFDPIFKVLASGLPDELTRYLNTLFVSKEINARSDDDKTLVLAMDS